ncbi:MAG: hypothetical protein FJ006_12545, partial [Chloroflexi bacterium]|nr:hypothetical protein [Chloroflexota bacterium]
MPRIRTIKPEFWTDEKILELSMPARLFFIGLWTFADDNGVLELKIKQLKARIVPADDVDIIPLLNELIAQELIVSYQVNGASYLQIKNFRKHQLIDRPRKTELPTAEDADIHMTSIEISGNQLKSTEISPGEGNGKGVRKGNGTGVPPSGGVAASAPPDGDASAPRADFEQESGSEPGDLTAPPTAA